MVYEQLIRVNFPEDLNNLSLHELKDLAAEIRNKIIETTLNNGGHLASNLGVVELTIALHKSFDFKSDKLVWDVGHQAYTHKLLTGRKCNFSTLRKFKGISGFVKPKESLYDAFLVGHSSTSIAAALGILEANEIQGNTRYVVSVIGDGALTGGLAFEGLNVAGESAKKLIVVLNDNGMSINKNIGSIAKYLDNIHSNCLYLSLKNNITNFFGKIPLIGKFLISVTRHLKNTIKSLIYPKNIFENLGFAYLGPIDGHNIKSLLYIFERAKKYDKPVLIHVRTKKGKGYLEAENSPENYHAFLFKNVGKDNFSLHFSNIILKLADNNEKICAITAAMRDPVGLSEFSNKFPQRFFDVGIAEECAVTFAAGLAAGGLIPIFAVYSTFLQRAFDQLLHDVACQNCHIVLAIDRAGFVGEDGETHQGLFDVAFLSEIPNTTIYAPSSYEEQEKCFNLAIAGTGICAVRYPKDEEVVLPDSFIQVKDEDYLLHEENEKDVLIITYGRVIKNLLSFPQYFKKFGVNISIMKLIKIHPLPEKTLEVAQLYKTIVFIEEGIKTGSIAEQFGARLYQIGGNSNFFIKAIEDKFIEQGTVEQQYKLAALDESSIKDFIKSICLKLPKYNEQEKV